MFSQPQEQHAWLQKLIGKWTFEGEASMGPDQPPMKSTGKETVRSLGGLWILAEGESEMPGGGTGTMVMTLGYDSKKPGYLGTWIGSMMDHLWIYEGELDPSGKKLTLTATGPSMTGDGMANYQDIIEFIADDHRTLTSQFQGPDGTWTKFMTSHYHRKV